MLETVFLLNTGVPMALLAGMAALFPVWLCPRDTRSHRALFIAVILSAGGLVLAGMAVFAGAYAIAGARLTEAVAARPGAMLALLIERSFAASLVWLPVLALTWFTLAQKIERRRGEDGIERGRT